MHPTNCLTLQSITLTRRITFSAGGYEGGSAEAAMTFAVDPDSAVSITELQQVGDLVESVLAIQAKQAVAKMVANVNDPKSLPGANFLAMKGGAS